MTEHAAKELILINPKCGGLFVSNVTLPVINAFYGPPMSLLTLAALTPKDYAVRIFNLKTWWGKNDFPKGALVGITSYSKNIRRAYKLADRYRSAGCHVVMGGPHVSALPEEALTHAHSVVIGEAESVWGDVLRDHEEDILKKTYSGAPVGDWHSLVFDHLSNMPPGLLQKVGIHATRGCNNHCEYCTVANRKNLRFADPDEVIKLILRIRDGAAEPTIKFNDDNIFSSPEYAKELFRRLMPLKVQWRALSSINIALDDEALELARESGCQSLQIGFETIHPEKLSKVHLTSNAEDYLRLITKIKKKGIRIIGSFMMGFDHDTHRDFPKLLVFLARARLSSILLGILTPFPGTALYNRFHKEGRITSYDWGKYEAFHVVFRPKHMSAFALKSWFLFVRTLSLFLAWYTLPIALFILYRLIVILIDIAQRGFPGCCA